ncbi:hypothetical protein HAX54_045236 [Datura stramonium]|uniref:Uncharacterized protein n=1 Tax=Datura stramonium TaxID=4076 RepID=A0ABS8RH49_DATST|nr:hypothetical protein [Datura stramonium]
MALDAVCPSEEGYFLGAMQNHLGVDQRTKKMKNNKAKRNKNWKRKKGEENNDEVVSLMTPYILENPTSLERERKDPFGILFLACPAQIAMHSVLCQHQASARPIISLIFPYLPLLLAP